MNKKLNLLKVYLHYVITEKDDKCPPWSIQASEMLHDQKKKQFIMIMSNKSL